MINDSEIVFYIAGHGSELITREYEFNNMDIEPGLKQFLENNITSYVAAGSTGLHSLTIEKPTDKKSMTEETYDIAQQEFTLHPNEPIETVINTYIQPKIKQFYVSKLQQFNIENEELYTKAIEKGIDPKVAEFEYKIKINDNYYKQIRPIYEKVFEIRSLDTSNPDENNFSFSIINYKSNKSYINYLFNNTNIYKLIYGDENIRKKFLEKYYEICFANKVYREEFNSNLEILILQDNPFLNTYDEEKRKIWIEAFQWMAKLEIYVFFVRLLDISNDLPDINFIYKDLHNRLERLIYKKENGIDYIINDDLYKYISSISFFLNIREKLKSYIIHGILNKYAKYVIKYTELVRIFRLLGFNFIYIVDATCRILDNSVRGRANIGYGIDIPFKYNNVSARTQRLVDRSELPKNRFKYAFRETKKNKKSFGGKTKKRKNRKNKTNNKKYKK